MPRAVLHLDLDAFFAAVEQRDKPSLRGKPVIVGGLGWRGVVSTASYEARRFDVGSAMPMALARRRCPHAAFLTPRFSAYRQASTQVMELARELSARAEPLSLDEAYLDLSQRPELADEAPLAVLLPTVASFRDDVTRRTGLTVSVGLATNKLVAKVASDAGKPDGCVVVESGREAGVLAPLGVRALPGVGAATAERLTRMGISTVGQLAAADRGEVVRVLGKAAGASLHAAARGVDPRDVVVEREAKSLSVEETFDVDITDRARLAARVEVLAARVAQRLADSSSGGVARTVTVKVRRYDFALTGRSHTSRRPIRTAREIAAAARSLLDGVDVAEGVRLVGVGVSGLVDHIQEDLLHVDEEVGPTDTDTDIGTVHGQDDGGPRDLPAWRPGQDVLHAVHGPGWVQGSGVRRLSVRFEGPHTEVGKVRTFALDDADLRPAEPPPWVP